MTQLRHKYVGHSKSETVHCRIIEVQLAIPNINYPYEKVWNVGWLPYNIIIAFFGINALNVDSATPLLYVLIIQVAISQPTTDI